MFFLKSERQEVFDAAHTYPFEEEIDSEFEEHLYEHLAQYIDVLPQEFQSGIIGRTLFQNDILMDEFEEWCNVTIEQYTTKINAIYEKRKLIVKHFNPLVEKMFLQSFHDGEILKAEQEGTTFTLLLDMRGGFTVESIVQLVFHNVQTEGKLEGNYLYDELVEIKDGFALRVLSSFGSPYREWTISFKEVTASYLYRPAVYIEPGEIDTWDEYVFALNPDDKYYIVKGKHFVEIDLASLSQTEDGISAGGISLGDNFEEARERIYCATYEEPYAHFSEPIPTDELIFAMFDTDPTIRVRAFNTIFALGEDVSYIVNASLRKANESLDEEMYFGILASHFNQLGCLDEDVKQKWISE